jgi:hypothetical protein
MEVYMEKSLPVHPSLEQLKKLAKDLVKEHAIGKPEALKLIRDHFPALTGKPEAEIVAYPFALHDAQSVIARQYGFASWKELSDHVEGKASQASASVPPPDVAAKLKTAFDARKQKDYALWCSVMSEEMKAFVTKDKFEAASDRLAGYFNADYRTTYMGSVNRSGRAVHFWRLWVKGWETDLLVRMALNNAGLISGLLFSDPFDTAINARK